MFLMFLCLAGYPFFFYTHIHTIHEKALSLPISVGGSGRPFPTRKICVYVGARGLFACIHRSRPMD